MAESIVKLIVDATQGVRSLGRFKKATGEATKKVELLQKAVRAQARATAFAKKKVAEFGQASKVAFDKAQKAAKKYQSTLGGLKGAILSLGVAALTKRMIGQAASFQQTQIRLKALSAEYGEFGKIQQLVKDNAKTFNLSQAEASNQFSDIYARLRPLGKSLDEIQTVYKGFNATALASGTSAAAASGAFLQLSQALGSGRLQGDEFRSVSEQIPGILGLVADEMGVTVGELKKLGSEGKITSDILINSLAKGFEENKDKIQQILAESPAAKFKEFSNATSELSNAIGTELLPVVTPAVQELTKLLKAAGDLPGPIKTAGAALIGFSAVVLALASPVSALLKGIAAFAPAAAGATSAAKLLAGAMVILKGAMLALPWVAAAAAVGGLIALTVNYYKEQSDLNSLLNGSEKEISKYETAIKKTNDKLAEAKSKLNDMKGAGVSNARAIRSQKRRVDELRSELEGVKGVYTAKVQVLIDIQEASRDIAGIDYKPDGPSGRLVPIDPPKTVSQLKEEAPTPTPTPAGSTAKGPDPAEEAEKLLKQQLEAGAKLSQQFTRQIQLREASGDLEREELQIEFARQDAVARIAETAEISQQSTLKELANKIAVLDVEKARAKVAAKQASDQQERDKAAAEAAQRRLEADPGFQMQKQFEELIKLENQVAAGATAIGSAFSNAFVGVISGAKSAQEGLAEMMRSVANHFLDMAAKIIAQQTAMILYGTIMKALGVSMPGSSGFNPGAPSITGNSLGDFGGGTPFAGAFRANGGPVSANTPYIVGERGPELMVPSTSGMVLSNSETRQQLDSQQSAASTREQLDRQQSAASTREQLDSQRTAASTMQPLDIRYESTVINSVEYVTAEQHRKGMAQAAERGRAMTLTTLQNSPRTRSKVGI